MHQSFRDGFEKLSWLVSKPEAFLDAARHLRVVSDNPRKAVRTLAKRHVDEQNVFEGIKRPRLPK